MRGKACTPRQLQGASGQCNMPIPHNLGVGSIGTHPPTQRYLRRCTEGATLGGLEERS